MVKCELMRSAKDYEALGLKKDTIELWEDGHRDNDRAGVVEWWYFDAILDDGSKIAACYSTKVQPFTSYKGTRPSLSFDVTTPEGKKVSRRITKFDGFSLAKDRCDVRYGENLFQGDLHDYHIKAVPVKGLGFDIQLHSISSPWRGETGYLGFGENHEKYFTWLCVVPRGTVEGTLTIDGIEQKIRGFGYHDHQWGNTIQFEFLNHWLWSRQSTADHSIVVFDFIMNKKYGYKRIPLIFIENKNGEIIFQSTDNVECRVTEELHQEVSDTEFPKVTHYTFRRGAKSVEYTLKVKDELDARYMYKSVPFFMRGVFKGTRPKYGRYLAEGSFAITEGEHVIHDSGELIYEFAYVGDEYKKHMEETSLSRVSGI